MALFQVRKISDLRKELMFYKPELSKTQGYVLKYNKGKGVP